jgi:glutamate racemase
MKIGVFDSGIGGQSVARAIAAELPEHEVIFKNDSQHVPYGTRPPDEILYFVIPIIHDLIDEGCKIIVIACNTVSTTLMNKLRETFEIPLVALEPMVKPAAEATKTKVIAVCATPTTLASPRYNKLKEAYANGIKVLEPDCSDWAAMLERKVIDEKKIERRILEVIEQGADVIVLGCTHYHWIEQEITELSKGRAIVIQPEAAIVKRVKQLLIDL